MKKYFSALIIFFIVISFSCNKEKDTKPAISGKLLRVVQWWEKDTVFYITPIPNPTTLEVNNTSWTMNISGNIANGTLTWDPIDAESAHIKFTVSNWSIPTSDELQKKLRRVVESVNTCEYGPSFAPEIHFTVNGTGSNNSFFYVKE